MTKLPDAYAWLNTLSPLPLMVQKAIELLGTEEKPGPGDNPLIMKWVTELANPEIKKVFTADSVPWCGLFMALVAKRAGKTPPEDPLWALNWRNFGKPVGQPGLGDVLTFLREGGGHVALYIGEDNDCYHVLGGNQSDEVCFRRISKLRMKSARRPFYMNQPGTVKPYILKDTGTISTDEG